MRATPSAGRRDRAPPRGEWRQRAGLVGLAWLLVLVQLLGVVHRVAHAPHVASGNSDAPLVGALQPSAQPALFGLHDEQSLACQLYDQLTHGDALWGSFPTGASAPCPPEPLAPRAPAARSAAATHFLARAPPILG